MKHLAIKDLEIDQPITEKMIVLVMPNASFGSICAVLDPLKVVNTLCNKQIYDWDFQSIDGENIKLSCGATIEVNSAIGETTLCNTLVICGSDDNESYVPKSVSKWIHRQYRLGRKIIAANNDIFSLAEAGILSGEDFAVHWSFLDVFRGLYSHLEPLDQLYVVGDKIFSSTSNLATTELVLTLIQREFGSDLVQSVQDILNFPIIRNPKEGQRIPIPLKYGSRNKAFLNAMEIITNECDEQISIQNLCKEVGVSQRQLQRLFAKYIGQTPRSFLMAHRLKKANDLLLNTNLTMEDVALSVGFYDIANFRNNYKKQYGYLPALASNFASL